MTAPLALFAYLAAAAAVLFLVHRFVQPLSRAAAAALLLLPLAFTGKAMLLGQVYAPIDLPYVVEPLKSLAPEVGVRAPRNAYLWDIHTQLIPWNAAVRSAFRAGEWPLWNPHMFAGDILAASGSSAPYSLLNLLGLVLPLPHALTFSAGLTFFFAGLGMFLFVRELGCSLVAALIAATAWMYSDFVAFWLEWPLGFSVGLVPLVFFAVHRVIVEEPSLRNTGVLTGVFAVLLLGGHPESALHAVALAAVYTMFLLARRRAARPLRAIGHLLIAGFLSLGLSAFYLLPIIDAVPQTQELDQRRSHIQAGVSILPWSKAWRTTFNNFVPFVYGLPDGERRTGALGEALPAGYAGSVTLALAALGLIRSRRAERWLLLAFMIFGILVGSHARFSFGLLAKLPFFDTAHNERMVFAAAFGMVVLAAFGVEELAHRRVAVAVFAGVLAVLVTSVALLLPFMSSLSTPFVVRNSLLLTVPLLLAAGAALSPGKHAAAWLIGALVLGQRFGEAGARYPSLPVKAFYPPIAELRELPRDSIYRIVSASFTFVPNIAAMYGVEDVRGYQALTLRRWWDTYPMWCFDMPDYNRVDDLTTPFLSLLNVRFALVPKPMPIARGWNVAKETASMYVLENPGVLPRAFIPREVYLGDVSFQSVARERDFRNRSWVAARRRGTAGGDVFTNPPGTLSITRLGTGSRFRIVANVQDSTWIVVSQTAWKGWKAYLDGHPWPVFNANWTLLGLNVPAGKHTIRLVYWPDAFTAGLIITGATIVVVVLFVILSRRRRISTRDGEFIT